jgi:hypothetical protein
MPSEITRSSGRFALPWGSSRMRLRLLLLAIGIITVAMVLGRAQVLLVQLEANDPGIGIVGQRFMIATPISNDGSANASNVQVTAATLGSAHLISPAKFPVVLGVIGPGQSYVFQTDFDATGLAQGTAYPLTITGTYQLNQVTVNFTLDLQMGLPPASPGSGTTETGMAYAEDLSGAPFPNYQIPLLGDDDEFIPVPIGPFVAGTPTLQSVAIQPFQGSGGSGPLEGSNAVSIPTNEDLLTLISKGVSGDPAEPSGASGGGLVFLSFNWDGAYKADGDTNFTIQNPRTMFPQGTYPFRSDQQVQFAPAIDRFIWIQQLSASGPSSAGAYRLAAARPEDIKTYGKTNPSKAWKSWLITNHTVGLIKNTQFDMPSLSVGTDSLYASWDVGCPSGTPTGPCIGLEVVRISLSDIKADKNPLPVEHVIDPGQSGGCPPAVTNRNSCFAHNAFLSQDTGDEVFWAGHNGNTQLRFFNWPAGNTYYWSEVGPIHGYQPNARGGAANGHVSSLAPYPIYAEKPPTQPPSADWLYRRPEDPIHGATRSGSKVYLAWNAAPHDGIPYPYIEVVIVNISDYSFAHEEIYDNSVAFGLASLAANACTKEVAISLGYGGGGQYPNHAVGFLNDTNYYGTTIGSVTGSSYGDYLNIRQNHTAGLNGAYFDAFGYALTNASSVKTGTLTKSQVNVDIRHVVFGHRGACAP